MNLQQLLADFAAKIQEANDRLGNLDAELERVRSEAFEAGKASRDQEFAAFGESEYQRGKIDGANEKICPELPPSDPEMAAKLEAAILKIGELETTVSAMQGQIVELQAQLMAKDAAMAEYKSAVKAARELDRQAEAALDSAIG